MSKYERYAKDEMEEVINSWEERYKKALEECWNILDQKQKLIEKFLEFLEFKSASLEGFDSLVVFMKKDFEEEKEKWEGELKK